MATATKRRKPKTRKPGQGENGRGHFAALARAAKAARPDKVEARQIAVKSIDPSPYQPRAEFPEEEIRGLAESIARQGQLQPIMVRPKGKRYELIDGERRWRAVKLIGEERLRAEVCEFSDAQARQIILASALQRKDLGPIEEARAFKASLAAGDFAGPTELAAALGLSQGQVSNRLRLLELPKDVQAKIISQEIPATHGRELARFKEHPELVSALAEDLVKDAGYNGVPTVEDFREGLVHDVARHTELVSGEEWDEKSGRRVPRFTPTPEQREELGIVSAEQVIHGKARPLEFATNQAAHKKMQAKWKKQWLKDNPVGKEQGSGVRGQAAAKKNSKKLSPAQAAAEKKRQEAAAHDRRAAQARQTANRVRGWVTERLRRGAAERLPKTCPAEQDRVILYLMIASESSEAYDYRERMFQFALRCDPGAFRSKVLWRTIEKIPPGAARDRLVATAAEILYSSQDGPRCRLPDHVAVMIADHLAVHLDALWKNDQKQQGGKTYYGLHTRDQLVDLGAELGVYLEGKADKAKMIRLLTSQQNVLKLPKELKMFKRRK